MINRSLIRIKTIQILYSYLLTRKDFHLVQEPRGTEISTDAQFAYSVYLDYLFLLLKLSSIPVDAKGAFSPTSDSVLMKNVVGNMLIREKEVTEVIAKFPENATVFNAIYPEILSAVADSRQYDAFKSKKKIDLAYCVEFWESVFTNIIGKSKSVEKQLRKSEIFSIKGMEMGLKFFIQTLKTLDDSKDTYQKAHIDLDNSLTLAYHLYHALLYLPVMLTDMQLEKLEAAKNKYLPTEEDLNPNMRFVENTFVNALRECEPLQEYIENNPEATPSTWKDSAILFDSLLNKIATSDLYKEYMSAETTDFASDANLWREILRSIVLPSDELAEALESTSVYWNDDLPIMGTFVLKTIRRSYAQADEENAEPSNFGKIELLPKFMNEADERFGRELFEYVVKNDKTYRSYIDRFIDVKQWDTERLAFMDIVLMETAIAEVINFPTIPIPVTFNEYIEIANDYSTPRSGQFINGIVYSVIKMLQTEGIINKK